MADSDTTSIDGGDFGPNIWLVDQMYRRYLDAPDSVSPSWQEFFEDYRPSDFHSVPQAEAARPATTATAATATAAPAAPQATAPKPEPQGDAAPVPDGADVSPLRGASAVIVDRMEASRDIPTATSVRTLPAKLLEVNRLIINNQLSRLTQGGKVSFTHLIGWAVVQALAERPAMNVSYREVDGKPHVVRYPSINLGLAMDMPRKDGSRTLLVPNIKGADDMDFRQFWLAYENVVRRVRASEITPEDFAGTTATLTNPGTVGTVQSVPRLMPDQGAIIGVGAIHYPPEYEGSDPLSLALNGIGRIITLTSTYDHRVIQGAESGELLRRIHQFLLGEDRFYDEIFAAMGIPYVPARWATDSNPPPGSRPWAEKQARVFQLINMYRVRGHLIADLDPLRMQPPAIHPELDPLTYGLTIWDLQREFATGGLGGHERLALGRILGLLRDAYCRTTGLEYMHIQEPDQKEWIQARVEGQKDEISDTDKRRILQKLNEAEAFETFLHRKFLGQKRFSLEGAEGFIPLFDAVLNAAADAGMSDALVGMAHRGRLNVLANIVRKGYAQIFSEFEDNVQVDKAMGSGDVKYHLGASGTHESPSGSKLTVEVVSNPSHLEAVDPVLEGVARARQDRMGAGADDLVLPVLIHGDAAFAGQGVVAETLNLSQLAGYHTGGTIHIVINNQVGFTTSAAEARSSFYATDAAKAIQAPILHVNGDDPEALVRAARLAFAFRQAFHKDIVIDLICYRRWGHNEADVPSFTQPIMYAAIENHRSPRKLYMERLVNRGELSLDEGEQLLEEFNGLLSQAFQETKELVAEPPERPAQMPPDRPTAVGRDQLDRIAAQLTDVPEGFTVHPKLVRVLDERRDLYTGGETDWAAAEALAIGSLLLEGHPVRFAGEDTQRGTFSHRHAVLVDNVTERDWMPLAELADDQAPVYFVDSLLSEFAALGFEYGYSIGDPDALVAWEAQFGDFVNGAQVVIDQFVIAGEDKWNQESGLVMLLPHGFEGQGPEHSSARIERFLQNAAEHNMRIVVPTTPAQYFHALRRQIHTAVRKPLIVFTPKSLLRTRASYSSVEQLTDGKFRKIIADDEVTANARRVLLCTGKVYYDLLKHREDITAGDVAIVRVEQLYPLAEDDLAAILKPHTGAELVWVQEEPENMGAWRYIYWRLHFRLGLEVTLVSRKRSASPATGSYKVHAQEQQELVAKAFT